MAGNAIKTKAAYIGLLREESQCSIRELSDSKWYNPTNDPIVTNADIIPVRISACLIRRGMTTRTQSNTSKGLVSGYAARRLISNRFIAFSEFSYRQ